MKIRFRHFMVLFLTLFFIFSVDSNAASTYRLTAKTICTTRTRVNVRKGPGIRYSVITTLKEGQKVKIGRAHV